MVINAECLTRRGSAKQCADNLQLHRVSGTLPALVRVGVRTTSAMMMSVDAATERLNSGIDGAERSTGFFAFSFSSVLSLWLRAFEARADR